MLRHPLLHFALVGSLLFVVSGSGTGRDTGATSAPRAPIEISAARIRKAEAAFAERVGRPAASVDRAALVRELVDEEILYREALRLGLDHGDPRVEERLLRKMKIVSRDPDASRAALLAEARALGIDRSDPLIRRMQVEAMERLLRRDPAAQISDEILAVAVFEEERRVRKPEAITFSQVYLGPNLPPEDEWKALRSRLADPRLAPWVNAEVGRPLPVGGTLRAQSYRRLVRQFDADFAEQVFEIDSGLWSEPVRSPYGYHLVFVHEVLGERMV
ncbi:MAG: peptidylprolyl isomerase, partial [Myxococcota bacterium]